MTDTRKAPSGPNLLSGVATLSSGTKSVTAHVPVGSQVVLTALCATTAAPANLGGLSYLVATDRLSFTIYAESGSAAFDVAWTVI